MIFPLRGGGGNLPFFRDMTAQDKIAAVLIYGELAMAEEKSSGWIPAAAKLLRHGKAFGGGFRRGFGNVISTMRGEPLSRTPTSFAGRAGEIAFPISLGVGGLHLGQKMLNGNKTPADSDGPPRQNYNAHPLNPQHYGTGNPGYQGGVMRKGDAIGNIRRQLASIIDPG